MDNLLLEKYAELIVKIGVNIQKGQRLVIASPIECAPITRMIAKAAYLSGAKDVAINWNDEQFSKIRYIHALEDIFDEFPTWTKELYLANVKEKAAFISILATDPELMKDVKSERIMRYQKAGNLALAEYREKMMKSELSWLVVSIPTKPWAAKVFPGCGEEEAVEKLWDAILKSVRVDQADPVAAWEEHKNNLKRSMEFLNTSNFRKLHLKNNSGTDLFVELPENHQWLGGSDFTNEGVEFMANMPTEEVFTLPKKHGVNGTVASSRPLSLNGNLIDEFTLTFKDGKVVDYSAKKGYEALKALLETDEGSSYLGEVALVPFDSPISNSGILFYNTLFDENASCHLALGKAYTPCFKGGEHMTKEELDNHDVSDSLVHEDFMIGTADFDIVGITAEGKEVQIFKNGNFAF